MQSLHLRFVARAVLWGGSDSFQYSRKMVGFPCSTVYAAIVVMDQTNAVLRETLRVTIRRLTPEDREEFVALVRESVGLLEPWVRLPDTSQKFDAYIKRFDGVTAYCILVCVRETGDIAGTITVSDIIRGPYQRATIGYNAFINTARQGFMSEGLEMVVRFAFQDLNLHRLEADIQPGNTPSKKFAKKLGFRREGYSPDFVCIDGDWKDHERWAIINKRITTAQKWDQVLGWIRDNGIFYRKRK